MSDPIGYIACLTCLTPKAIMQGTGRRKNYLYGRCKCGPDNRTGAEIQAQFKTFHPLDEVEAEIARLKEPQPEPLPEPTPEPEPEPTPEPLPAPEPQPKATPKPNRVKQVGAGMAIGAFLGAVFKLAFRG
ncbi:hypothetical protein [Photobacterium halotolerans]|uniref:hypothetical protein n=1 Tax=Photobacterium halotolerans TaxID=265726 RepID=UPI0013736F22|nr:hypothetical protein [Photobacterium halotolerans]NAW87167.1 hypothetical protein [Photobacterium halotolerans]